MKQCSKCKENKELREFYKKAASKDGLQLCCKDCSNLQVNLWTSKNRERSNEIKNNWTSVHYEEVKEYRTEWDSLNRGKKNSYYNRYIATKIQALPKWLTKDQLLEIENLYIEAHRLTRETGTPHEVDHIMPLQGKNVCGLHVPWNLRVVTRSINRRKSNKI